MANNIKPTYFGTIAKAAEGSSIFFDKKVSISFDDFNYDPAADYKVLVQIEPPTIMNIVDKIPNHSNNFDLILTWHPNILNICHNSELFPFGDCWIKKDDRYIFPKNKDLSIVASTKNYAPGHKLRHQIIKEYPENLSTYGHGYNYVENKITALKDYRFSLVIENESSNNWFTEKLIDCLVTGTVPIFWGCPNIHEFFDTRGFILFNNINQIPNIKANCNKTMYENLLPFIKKNYHSALKYVNIFDRIKKTIEDEF